MILTARTVAQVDSAFHANCQEFTSWVGFPLALLGDAASSDFLGTAASNGSTTAQ